MSKKQRYEQQKKNFKKNVPHAFDRYSKPAGKWYCSGCGLVALNNEATRKAMAKPCDSMED